MKKNILITGSSRGIGLAIAERLLCEGNNVVINGRNKKTLLKIKKKINYLIMLLVIFLLQNNQRLLSKIQ